MSSVGSGPTGCLPPPDIETAASASRFRLSFVCITQKAKSKRATLNILGYFLDRRNIINAEVCIALMTLITSEIEL